LDEICVMGGLSMMFKYTPGKRRFLLVWDEDTDDDCALPSCAYTSKATGIIAACTAAKYRIRKPWKNVPQLRMRKMVIRRGHRLLSDFTFDTLKSPTKSSDCAPEGIVTSSQGVNNVVMTNWVFIFIPTFPVW